MIRFWVLGIAILGLHSIFASELAAQTVESNQLASFNISKQVPISGDYHARGREITVPAGATIPEHAHSNRPGIVYVISGEITEFRGEKTRVLRAGDTLTEQIDTVHRFVNHGQDECVLLAFDIHLPETAS